MGFFGKLFNEIKVNSSNDDNYFIDDDYQDDTYYDNDDLNHGSRPQIQEKPSGSLKIGGFLGKSKVVPLENDGMEITHIKPNNMDDSKSICNDLLAGKAVLINLEGISTEMAQRILDFTLGAVFAIDGDMQMISKYIFVATPNSIGLSGEFQRSFDNIVSERAVSHGGFGQGSFGI